jgi:hypothetical protein
MTELLSPPQKSHELPNLHIAYDALDYEPESFAFTLEEIPSPILTPVYALRADGLPAHENFLFASHDPLKKTATVHFEFKVLENNTLQILSPKGEEIVQEAPFVLKEILKGQEIELVLISKERRTCTKAQFTPSPISLADNGASFALRTMHRKGTHFALEGKGLSPLEKALVIEQSGDEIREHVVVANEEGLFSLRIEPIVLGKLGGDASVSIIREEHESESRIDYAWGGRLEIESRRDTPFHPLIFVANQDPKEIDTLAALSKLQKEIPFKLDRTRQFPLPEPRKQAASEA